MQLFGDHKRSYRSDCELEVNPLHVNIMRNTDDTKRCIDSNSKQSDATDKSFMLPAKIMASIT